ncbi:ketopantoate reductase family protein [Moritella sp. 36]|uniref:ketopantoate reductase family protein n=1 Tax=Moritella sp. 36 TaxID=2746233 RepID=UPI001BA65F76|nr:ketopantoate reductase family protein [Moritella sp. 36]QUM88872.1 ketopantoate reductase family protein [Moritella sp. 36]
MLKVSIIGLGSLGGFIAARLSSLPDIQIQWVYRTYSLRKDKQVLLTSSSMSEPLVGYADTISYNLEDIFGEIVFITTKAYDNSTLLEQTKTWKHKTIVLLQNGIGEDEKLAQGLAPNNAIVSGITHLKASYTTSPYQVTLHNQLIDCIYAVYQGQPSAYLDYLLNNIFNDVERESSSYHVRLPKLLISFAANAASFLYDSDMRGLATNPKCRELMLEIEQEFLPLFNALNLPAPTFPISKLISLLDAPLYENAYFSMKEDSDNGRQVEFEEIFKASQKLANQYNVPFILGHQVCQHINNILQGENLS